MGAGRDKAFELLDGVAAVVAVGREIAGAVPTLVVVGTAGRALPPLDDGWARVDDPAEQGPLRGIHTGLAALDERGIELAYLGACDAITLTTAHVAFVLDTLARDDAVDAVVPRQADGTPCPLHAAVRVRPALAAAQRLLDEGRRAAQALSESLTTRFVEADDLPDARALLPANTPQQWAHAAKVRRP